MKPEWVELTSKDGSEMKWLIRVPTSPFVRRKDVITDKAVVLLVSAGPWSRKRHIRKSAPSAWAATS